VIRFLLLVSLASTVLAGKVLTYMMELRTHTALPGINILDQKYLDFDSIDGVSFHELSDLTYLPQSHALYLISDKGALFRFDAHFDTQMTLKPQHGYRLHNAKGKRLKKRQRDSEGLTHDGHNHLFVSREQRPRINRLSPEGQVLRQQALPEPLRSPHHYRRPNKMLEALAWHPNYGLITAKETPPKGVKKTDQALYDLKGHIWKFQAEDVPDDGVTAIEVTDDGNILVLERSFDTKNFLITITLKKVYLTECKHRKCRSEILARLRSDQGWVLDNFEGLARVAPHRYVMVSDDGNNVFERTLLIYFELTR